MNHEADQVVLEPQSQEVLQNNQEIKQEKQQTITKVLLNQTVQAMNPGLLLSKQIYVIVKTTYRTIDQLVTGQTTQIIQNLRQSMIDYDGVTYEVSEDDDSYGARGIRFIQRSLAKFGGWFIKKNQEQETQHPQEEEKEQLVNENYV